jgi:hypothetical protein
LSFEPFPDTSPLVQCRGLFGGGGKSTQDLESIQESPLKFSTERFSLMFFVGVGVEENERETTVSLLDLGTP